MAKRLYISKIVGTGSEDDPFRPKVADYPVRWAAIVGSNADGTPKFPFAFVIVGAADHTALLADVDIRGLPELSLDAKLSTLSAPVRNKLIDYFDEFGIDRSGITVNSTMRDVVRRVGRHIEASFSENGFDTVDQ